MRKWLYVHCKYLFTGLPSILLGNYWIIDLECDWWCILKLLSSFCFKSLEFYNRFSWWTLPLYFLTGELEKSHIGPNPMNTVSDQWFPYGFGLKFGLMRQHRTTYTNCFSINPAIFDEFTQAKCLRLWYVSPQLLTCYYDTHLFNLVYSKTLLSFIRAS